MRQCESDVSTTTTTPSDNVGSLVCCSCPVAVPAPSCCAKRSRERGRSITGEDFPRLVYIYTRWLSFLSAPSCVSCQIIASRSSPYILGYLSKQSRNINNRQTLSRSAQLIPSLPFVAPQSYKHAILSGRRCMFSFLFFEFNTTTTEGRSS